MFTLDDFKAEQMKSPAFAKAYREIQPEMAIIQAIIEARENTHINPAGIIQAHWHSPDGNQQDRKWLPQSIYKTSSAAGCRYGHESQNFL